MEIIIALVDRTLVMMILAQTQGAESSIAMLVLMNVLNKNKLFTKIVIKRLAMPTMGMTTNPKTTSSTTWTRHLIVKPMWMLKTKVIKIHQGVISGIILAMTKGAEDNLNKIKMREPTLDNVNNLVKIRNNILNMSQVKLVFTSNANPMLWNMEDEENMYGKLKFNMPKFKGEDDAEAYLSWALKVDKIFRIHNYSGAKKVAMASLEFEDYANTWWEQVVTLREEKGDPPIDTWEDMKEEMEARFVPKHYKTDLFNKLQKLKQGTKTVEEFFKEMELTMMRANIQESEDQTIARFFNGLNYPIKRVVEFQQYSNMVELVHQASKAERQVNEDIKYSKSKQYFASNKRCHPQTQGAESSIAMLVLMNVRNKNKLFTKIVIKRLAMPTMGMTTNPKTTSSTTWNRHLIVKPMLMLKTKVIKIHQGVTSGTILAMTKGAEDNLNMIKMRGPTLDNRNNILNMSQVKLVFTSNANPMLWLVVEDLLYHLKPQEMKASVLAEGTWKMKRICTKTVEEFFKEMELTMMRANIQESENQTIARFFNGLNYPIKRVVEFQQYSNMVELVHQASKAERQVNEDIKYSKSKQYFASKLATSTPTTSVKPTASSTPSKQPSIQSRMKQTVSSTASSKASTGPSNVTCFKCGTQGHKSFECKNTKVMITMENGDIETLSEGEYEALVQAAVANEEDYDEESGEDPLLCTHDPSPSLVVTRVLTTQPQAMEDQRCNIFQTRAGIGGKSIKVIIDGGSCHNLASTELCEKLNLTLRKHPHPYHVQWLSDKGNVKIQHTVTVNFKIGPYEDTVECDVVPMTVCHMLLGRPWKFDKKAIHDGYSNAYTFKVKDKKFELRPMTPSQIIADNAKALARAQHHIHHSELRGEGATHQKESERHHPHMSERKSVLLATKSEWRE
ncbi:hypothetical protein QYE76_018572, partial [Lolium multiflorum]